MIPTKILCTTMRKLALEAGRQIMDIYRKNKFTVTIKGDDSPVTLADHVADQHIFNGLNSVFPDKIIISEERSETHQRVSNDFFIVDPLDGTKNFIEKNNDFTVNIAYIKNCQALFGVIYAPAHNRLFYTNPNGQTVEEIGTHAPNSIGHSRILSLPSQKNHRQKQRISIIASRLHGNRVSTNYINKYPNTITRTAGSSLKFCLIASGEADIYPRIGRTMEWDTAAGQAILTKAGGRVLCFDSHQPLTYAKTAFENPAFIAAAPAIKLYR